MNESDQLTVSWGVPANNGAVLTGYTVQWKSGDAGLQR